MTGSFYKNGWMYYLVCIISCVIAYQLQFKGFGGFDLSPMISANNLTYLGQPPEYCISNPMPPGFTLITYLFTTICGYNYGSFFTGNILFCILLYSISELLIYTIRKNKPSILLNLLRLQNLSIYVISLITDGHFYITDTSNMYCCFAFFVFEIWFIDLLYGKDQNKILSLAMMFSLSFCLFLRLNVVFLTFPLILLGIVITDYITRTDIIHFIKNIFMKIFILLCSSIFFYLILKHIIHFNMSEYIKTMIEVLKHRQLITLSSLDINAPYIDMIFKFHDDTYQLLKFLSFSTLTCFLISQHCKSAVQKYSLFFVILFLLLYIESCWTYAVIFNSLVILFFYNLKLKLASTTNNTRHLLIMNFCLLNSLFYFAGLICMLSNFDVKSSDFPIILVSSLGLLIAYTMNNDMLKLTMRTVVPWFLILFLIFSGEGVLRMKMLLAGPPSLDHDFSSTITNGFFKNLKSSQNHQDTLENIDKVIQSNHQAFQNNQIFLGARLEYLYMKYKLLPPKGLPLWWHYTTSYNERDIDAIKKIINSDRVQIMIFTSYPTFVDTAKMDAKLEKFILENPLFSVDKSLKGIIVLKKITPSQYALDKQEKRINYS